MFWSLPVMLLGLLIGGVLPGSSFLSCVAEEYYVTPTHPPNPACPSGEPCHTLNDYAKNASTLLSGKDNVSLIFLDGLHNLTEHLLISNTVSLTMTGPSKYMPEFDSMDDPTAVIHFLSDITVLNVLIFAMEHLEFNSIFAPLHPTHNNRVSFSIQGSDSKNESSNYVVNIEKCTLDNFWFRVAGSTIHYSKSNISDCIHTYYFLTQYSIQDSYIQRSLLLVAVQLHSDQQMGNRSNTQYVMNNVHFLESSLYFQGPAKTTMKNCLFENSSGDGNANFSPIIMQSIDLLFAGDVVFANNAGSRGGAMYLGYQSTISLENGANVTFINNTADDLGGAIYIFTGDDKSQDLLDLIAPTIQVNNGTCFQLSYNINNSSPLNSSLHFLNNTALNGGVDIYGPFFKSKCPVTPDGKTLSYEIQRELFHFGSDPLSTLSSVSSDPKRVCLCENGVPVCANFSYIVQERSVTPGEMFTVSAVLVGNDFGTVSGGVFAVIDDLHYTYLTLGRGQGIQQTEYTNCTALHFSIHSNKSDSNELLRLVADTGSLFVTQGPHLDSNFFQCLKYSCDKYQNEGLITVGGLFAGCSLLTTPIFLNITVLDCPLGFILDSESLSCVCIETLDHTKSGVNVDNCTVVDGTGLVYRSGTTWVSRSGGGDNETEGVLVHKYCPYSYCKTNTTGVDLYHPDTQCDFNHSGMLCGKCSSNLSLVLGSSKCLPCTNDGHIALLIVFIVAGIALVLFIKIFDLTVARGTVNGLILYANIIWINQSIFFPPGPFSFLRVFIAWLNLDFGIETCFFQGLDAYWKTWLQFVFPIYVWVIAGLIIIICRYSTKATKLFGNNSVHVLATLFLLSYVKLLRTIITAFGFAIIKYPEGNRIVWLFDGNVQYFELRHLLLFVAALLALFVLWLPYTGALLLVPYLKKYSHHFLLSWVGKWKPLFDAHYGPLKDKHQYWVGLTLLVRVVLAIVAVVIQAISPMINVLLIVTTSAFLIFLLYPVYKSTYVTMLEVLYLLNLVIVSGGFPYTTDLYGRMILVTISTSVSFVTFLVTVILHGYLGLKNYCRKRRGKVGGNVDYLPRHPRATQSLVSVNADNDQCREPLLESNS